MRFLPALAELLAFAAVAHTAPVPAAAVEVDDMSPVWSPDGRRIAFVRVLSTDTDRTRAVYLVRADGTGLRRLTDAGGASSPAWSPVGKHVAFTQTSFRDDHEISTVTVARADGSRVRRVTVGSSPAWSPDGKRIAFVRETNIGVVDVESRTVRLLTNFPRFCSRVGPPCHGGASSLSWSPDGKRLAVALGKRIGVIPASGGEVRFIGSGAHPQWSPDGGTIAAACLYSTFAHFLVPNASEQWCSNATLDAQVDPPRWSTAGDRVALGSCWRSRCSVVLQARAVSGWTVLHPGRMPFWSPDGRELVFSAPTDRGRSWRLHVMGADGTDVRRLPLPG